MVFHSASCQAELRNNSSTCCKALCLFVLTCLTLQQYHRVMLSACIIYKITERLRGWYWCTTGIFVITNLSTTSDIDHLILTELIINMTGSCNKENRSCALSKQEPTLRIKSRGHWLRGFLAFISVALPQHKYLLFISLITDSVSPCCWQQCAVQKVALLRD